MIENIPEELRALTQWVGVDNEIDKTPLDPKNGRFAKNNDRSTWGTFEQARQFSPLIGFVITEEDPYALIDLDDHENNPATPEDLIRHKKIMQAFNSYTEISISGRGYHILVKGQVPIGSDKDHVGIYSSGRYVLTTGNVTNPAPINEYQELLTLLQGEMTTASSAELIDRDSIMDDSEVVDMGMRAKNAAKFNSLCAGDISAYPSQSEADFALISIIAYYTKDNEQVRRIFRMSALGKRDKATRNDKHINYGLSKIRAKELPPIDFSQLRINSEILANEQKGHIELQEPNRVDEQNSSASSGEVNDPSLIGSDNGFEVKIDSVVNHTDSPKTESKYKSTAPTLPPGLIGELATYFYSSAMRPVPEIALTAAIAMAAGICGRSYNVSGTGLNQYIVLLAKTGSGKEGAAAGIEKILNAVCKTVPMIEQFIGPSMFASGQALMKVLSDRPCFMSVLGEFGLTLQDISDHRANASQKMLRRVLLDLYTKSGWDRTLQSSVYADSDKNTKIVQAPCVSIFGESTPDTFYEGLDASHIAEGLIPRFSIIEYTGDRPARNENAGIPPAPDLVQRVADLATTALTTSANGRVNHVTIDANAKALLDDFDTRADKVMNGSGQTVEIELWNRAHLKALKLAGLIAVGCHIYQPTVTREIAQWAIDFIVAEISSVAKRFESGDVGKGDGKQIVELKRVVQLWATMGEAQQKSYCPKISPRLLRAGIIPHAFLSRRLISVASFRNDRMGATNAIKRAIREMIESDFLSEIPTVDLQKQYGYGGTGYGIGGSW